MRIKIKKLIWLIASAPVLFASATLAFSTSPLKYEATIGSGESLDFLVSVENESNDLHSYQALVAGARQDQNGRLVFDPNIDVAENWVKFKKEIIDLKAGEKKDLVFTVSVPKNTPPGGHYLGLGVIEKSDQGVSGRLLTILTLQVAGVANESLRLENFYPVKRYFFDNDWRYFLQFKNTGNIDLPVSGSIQILSGNNKVIFSKTVNLGSKLFSGSSRNADLKVSVDKIIFPGRYQAVMTVHYGLTNQEIVSVANFWYLPFWFLLVGLVLMIIIFLFFIFRKTRHEIVE